MGLLDQYDKAKLYAKGLLGRVAQNYEDLQNSPQKIADLLSNIPGNAQSMYQGLLNAPAQVADLFSQQKAQQLAQALQKPQQANPQQWMDAGMELSGMAPVGGLMAHTVYHGSPHKFDKFDMSKIGTGEGAQAYGHGLYFAESPEVAKQYATKLSADREGAIRRSLAGFDGEVKELEMMKKMKAGELAWPVNRDGNPVKSEWLDRQIAVREDSVNVLQDLKQRLGGLNSVYKVDIPDEAIPRMLDWDRSAKDQPEAVQNILKQWNGGNLPSSLNSGDAILRYLQSNLKGIGKGHMKAEDLLKEAGVPGIKYLDGASRSSGSGSNNYVLFDDRLPRILEVNGQPTGLRPWSD